MHVSALRLFACFGSKLATNARKLLDEAARVLATGGKYMIFSAFSNDELGHKDMADMLVHPGFGGQVQASP